MCIRDRLGRGNVSGIGLSVGVVTATSFNGTINTVAQPNITSLGTLTSLTVQGNVQLEEPLHMMMLLM